MGRFEIKGEGRRFAAFLLSLWLLELAGYYFAAALAAGGGSLPPPQQDTLLYCQAARRICEGHAFSFTAGTAVSTGTTSVLYPFILAIPYALGFTGDSLLTAGFFLNSLFLLVFLFGWARAFRVWLKPKPAVFATVLTALSPIVSYSAFAQSDTGLWMAVSALFVWGLAVGNPWLTGAALVVAPWVRPEGMVIALAFGLVACFSPKRGRLGLFALALASCAGVFLLNWILTGACGFSSVSGKGFFRQEPFPQAISDTVTQLVSMARDLLFGQASFVPRALYALPFLGSVALVLGCAVSDWSRRKREWSVLALAVGGSVLMVAQSGWQGSNMDRYLAWTMPVFVLFSAVGWWWCYERLSRFPSARLLVALPVAYAACGTLTMVAQYGVACDHMRPMSEFAKQLDGDLLCDESLGLTGGSGLAYYLGNRRVANLAGVYSPEFTASGIWGVIEILRNEPSVRFDHWLFAASDPVPEKIAQLHPTVEWTGPRATQVRRADWRSFDCGPTSPAVSNLTLKCRVDVAYEADEKRSRLESVAYYGMRPFEPLIEVAPCGDRKTIVDCGRLFLGEVEMDVDSLEPGRDVTVLIRTMDKVEGRHTDLYGCVTSAKYTFSGVFGLHLAVDGTEVACCHTHLDKPGFTEVAFKLPGRFITREKHRIGLHGDHAAFAYWFYQ